MFAIAKVITKNGEEKLGFMTTMMILRIAKQNGWKPKGENPLVCDRKDSRTLSTALKKGLKRLQVPLGNCDTLTCENPCDVLATRWHFAELIEMFLSFFKGKPFEIKVVDQRENEDSRPQK